MVHPGGKTLWCVLKLFALKKRPPKAGETVIDCPSGRYAMYGAMRLSMLLN
jgi:hypothetical protein